jgi:ABC-type transporter Mla subunit MlaD
LWDFKYGGINEMSVGFRKSFFGFNCDDVIEYIQESHRKFSAKEKELNQKIDSLDNTIEDINAQLEDVKAAKAVVEAQLKEYTDKYDEIERLSQNIGKLYLVAQANAKSIMQNATQNRELASKEVAKNLHSIDSAHEQLATLKAEIMQTSNEFVNKVDTLVTSLTTAREQVSINNNDNRELVEQFESLLADVNK